MRKSFFGSLGQFVFLGPGVQRIRLLRGHGKILLCAGVPLIPPGGVDVDGLAVQCGHSPDVGGVGERVAVDALQLQEKIVGTGIAVADGNAVLEQAIGQVADGGVVPGVIVGAVGGDPLVIGPGDLPLGGGGGNGPLLPQRVMDGDGGSQCSDRYSSVRSPAMELNFRIMVPAAL